MHGRPARRPRPWLAVAPLLVLTPLVFVYGRVPADLAHVATPLATALTIWVSVQSRVRPLETRWLVWVGQRSYGLYLWHYPVAYLSERVPAPWLVTSSIGLVVSFGLAALSWRFVETPFLRLKDRGTQRLDPQHAPRRVATA
jgi:peptidoglycan/LPS O-acetylase OafA/YrhL